MKTVVGMFSNVGEAQRTFEDLTRMGFSANDISVVTRSDRGATERMRLSTIDAPDAGRICARGPIADALSQRNAGLAGTLKNAGVSSALAEHYATAVRQGETLESVVVEDRDADKVVDVMRRHAARYGTADPIHEAKAGNGGAAAATAAAAATTGALPREARREEREERERGPKRDGEEEAYIPVMREEIHVGKREVERGGVHVDVRVVEKPVSEHVTLREEHVNIERRPADRAPRPDEALFRGGQLDMTEHGEEPVVSKEVRVVEEIRLHKSVTERDELIEDKLRTTDVAIDELAGERKAYRAHFESLGRKGSFEEELPAYELGRNLRGERGDRWEEIEPSARERWEKTRPGTWERYKDAIRHAFSRGRNK
ncbi:MAG: DUF2382 domain-containing protein [Labilithrix sp.]|nr:DUF2382 domain-containing protein [Labilithrix sp.]